MNKDFDNWNEKKKQIHDKTFVDYVHSREVWWCSLGLNIGFEQDGKHEFFERPVLVIKKFSRDTVLIVPLSSRLKNNNYQINFTHTGKYFSALISQLRLISTKRLRRKMYKMDSSVFGSICSEIRKMI